MSSAILDASAVLAVLNAEKGCKIAEPHLFGGTISSVNYSEVLKKTIEAGGCSDTMEMMLAKQRLNVVSFDREQSAKAAAIWPLAKPFGLSFADRACMALGLTLDLPIFTADTSWKKVDIPIHVTLIRGR